MKKHLLPVTALLLCFFSAFSQGPSITSVNPSSGLPGTVITITGTGLGEVTAVSFGGTPARSFTVTSDTSVSAVVGGGSSGPVEVSTADSSASFPGFTFVTPSLTLVNVSDGSEDGQVVQFRVEYQDGYVAPETTTVGYRLTGTAVAGTDFPAVSGTVQIAAGEPSALIGLTPADDRIMEGTEEIVISLVSADAGAGPVSFDPQAEVSATITDNDTGAALSVTADANGAEPGTSARFRISFPAGVTSSVPTQVSYAVGGSATPDADYAALSGTLVLPAGENAADLVIDVTDDTVFEGPETITITLQSASNAVAAITLQAAAAEATISDNDEDPADRMLTLSLVTDGEEGGSDIRFRVSFPEGVTRSSGTVVSYTVGGTAEPGADHSGSSGTVTIPAGARFQEIVIPVNEDMIIEGEETVTVTLTEAVSGGTELGLDPDGPVTARLIDNDNTPMRNRITLAAVANGAEPATAGRFEVRFPAGVTSSAATTVNYQVAGNATPGTDYTALPGTVEIPAGDNSASITVDVLDDSQFEGDETVQLTLVSASGVSSPTVATQPATLTITDNEEDPATNVITLTAAGNGAENGPPVRFRFSFPQGVVKPFTTTVSYTVSGTATAGADYAVLPGSLVIPAGDNSAELAVPVLEDQVIEGTETIVLSPGSASVPAGVNTVVTVSQDPVTAQLADNDNTPMRNRIMLAAVANGAEPATSGRFEVRFPAGVTSSAATTVNYRVAGSATAGTDYTALLGSVEIPAGFNSASITVGVLDDNQFEGDETVQLTLLSASGVSSPTVATQPVTLTITDNEEDPATNVITLTAAGNGAEGGDPVRFRFSYPQGIVKTFNTTVAYAVSGTATAGTDYAPLPGSLVIPAGQNFAELVIPVLEDQVIERTETLVLTPGSASVPAGVTTVVTVRTDPVTAQVADNDNTPDNNRIMLAAVANGAEPATSGRFEVRFPAGVTSSAATTVNYEVAGSATAGTDYSALPGTVVIPAGSNSASITVSVLDDEEYEGNETVQLTLVSASGIPTPAVDSQPATLTITENDEDPATNVITLTAAGNGAEGGDSVRFRISYPQGVVRTFNTTVSYAVSGTATAGTDYAPLPGSLVIPAGQNFAELVIPVLDDQVIEPVETLVITLESASVTAGESADLAVRTDPATAEVADNDNTADNNRIMLAAVANAAEPATDGRFEVRFPPGIMSSVPTTVTYRAEGSAVAGADYNALPGTVTIPAGANSVSVEIGVLDDRIMEGNEVVRISLGNATNDISTLTVAATPDSVLLADDDNRAPNNTVSLTRVRDGGEPGTSAGLRIGFPEQITSSSPTTVTFAIGGTAVNGTDYQEIPARVVIPAGENAVSLDLAVIDDQIIERPETVVLTLTAATSADTLLNVAPGAVSVTLTDNDQIPRNEVLTLVKESDGAEPGTDAVFVVRYPEGIVSSAATTVTYTIGGTATNGADYSTLSGTAEIPAGDNGAEIRVAVADDQEIEITETVALTLQGASSAVSPGLTLGTTSSVIANIADNDGSSANLISLVKVQDGAEPSTDVVFRVGFPAGVSSSAVTIVSYSVGGSAGNGTDYRTLPGSVIIPAGSNAADIVISVLDDGLVDRDETVELTLTAASNSLTSLSTYPATPVSALIRDDDIPAITSFSPSAGPSGTAVTISGSRFDPSPENNLVFFGAVQAVVTAATPGTLTATVPPGATYQPLTVTVGGLSARSATPFDLTFSNDAGIDPRAFASRIELDLDGTASYLAAGDFDGDGRIDLLTTNYQDRSVSVLRNRAAGGGLQAGWFADRTLFATSGNPVSAIIQDINGDGKPDALVVQQVISAPDTSYLLSVYRNTSTADSLSLSPAVELSLTGGVPDVDVADMNGDGRPDLVSRSDSIIRVFTNTGSAEAIGFQAGGEFAAGTAARGLLLADLNDDGKPDMAVGDEGSDRILVFINTASGGNAGFAGAVPFSSEGGPVALTAGDFNSDGRPDLAVRNGSGRLSVLLNTGTGGAPDFTPAAELPAEGPPGPVSAGDLDGDGRPDLILAGETALVTVFRNTGSAGQTEFSGPLAIQSGSTRGPVRIADLDGDSKPELVMISAGDSTISVLQNASDQPVLASFLPLTACAGTTVTLTGSNLGGATAITFGDVPAAAFTVVSSTSVTVTVPPGAGGEITVTTPKGMARTGGFILVPVPAITVSGSTTFETGGQVILSATTGEGYSYQWQKDGVDLAGATGRTYTARESGSYRIRILDGNCGSVSEAVAVTAVFTLPPTNFTVSATAATCRGSANGEIQVSAALPMDYTATITGSGKNLSARFDRVARFSELAAGTYNICLTVAGQPDYRLCYDVVVAQPEDLAVYTAVNPSENTLDLMLSGSDTYFVELNGEVRTVRGNQITLGLKPGANMLKVFTGKDCQGIVERVIMAGTVASVFPNPFESVLNLSLPGNAAADASVQIVSPGGKVVYSGRFVNNYGNIRMDLPDLVAGVYFLKLSTGGTESVYKIIRK